MICLQKIDDIVLLEIYNLIEKEFKKQENNIYEGSSLNTNMWKVGITNECYKYFTIYNKKITKKISLNNNKISDNIICGEIPDGFIICGWKISTNCNSKPYDIVCSWEKQKDLNIIGSNCYKFKLNYTNNSNSNNNIEIKWILEIFCFHSDFLISDYSLTFSDSYHYFSNCDCELLIGCIKDQNDCYYNKFFEDESWKKIDKKSLASIQNENYKKKFEKLKTEKLEQDLREKKLIKEKLNLETELKDKCLEKNKTNLNTPALIGAFAINPLLGIGLLAKNSIFK